MPCTGNCPGTCAVCSELAACTASAVGNRSRMLCNFSPFPCSRQCRWCVIHQPPFSCTQGPFLPGYATTPDEPRVSYGLHRLDHAVGNVPRLIEHLEHVMGFTGGVRALCLTRLRSSLQRGLSCWGAQPTCSVACGMYVCMQVQASVGAGLLVHAAESAVLMSA
eukprot:GHRQ01029507.1.p1 GENE.GHRQ01029507.1~~GHRQ01029507.1.p1  ORF type:complete len:164 (-),score=4.25 GHRQ01029507.1:479-970(-)